MPFNPYYFLNLFGCFSSNITDFRLRYPGQPVVAARMKRSSFNELICLALSPCSNRANVCDESWKVSLSSNFVKPCKALAFLARAEYAVRFPNLCKTVVLSHPYKA